MLRHRPRKSIPTFAVLATTMLVLLAACSRTGPASGPGDEPGGALRVPIPPSEAAPALDPSPAGASWHLSGDVARFGAAGADAMIELTCRGDTLVITRPIPADVGASALFAIQGPRHILRLAVDATPRPGSRQSGYFWRGTLPANDPRAEVLTGPFTGTLPGGGLIKVGAGDAPREILRRCRSRAAKG